MNHLHPKAEIHPLIPYTQLASATCTVSSYVGDDVWMEETTWPANPHDPLAVGIMLLTPWWPTQEK